MEKILVLLVVMLIATPFVAMAYFFSGYKPESDRSMRKRIERE